MKIFCITSLCLLPLAIFASAHKELNDLQTRLDEIMELDEMEHELLRAHELLKGQVLETEEHNTVSEPAECRSDFMELLEEELAKLLENGDEAAINFLCDPVERDVLIQKATHVEEDIMHEEDGCMLDMEKHVLESKDEILGVLSSEDACRAEVSSEIATIHESMHRNLFQASNHRKLPVFIGFVCLVGLVVFLTKEILG